MRSLTLDEGNIGYLLRTDHDVISYRLHSKGDLCAYDEKYVTYESNMLYSCYIVTLHRVLFRVVNKADIRLLRIASRVDTYNVADQISLCKLLREHNSVDTIDLRPPLDSNVRRRLQIAFYYYDKSIHHKS